MLSFKQLIESTYASKLKNACKKHNRAPETHCDEIASSVYQKHGNKFTYHAVVEKKYKGKGDSQNIVHAFMRDPESGRYFDGSGHTTLKKLNSRWINTGRSTTPPNRRIEKINPEEHPSWFKYHYRDRDNHKKFAGDI